MLLFFPIVYEIIASLRYNPEYVASSVPNKVKGTINVQIKSHQNGPNQCVINMSLGTTGDDVNWHQKSAISCFLILYVRFGFDVRFPVCLFKSQNGDIHSLWINGEIFFILTEHLIYF